MARRTRLRPESIVWIFGHGRTGSTWLAKMLSGMPRSALWNEPLVGELFGNLYQGRDGDLRGRAFILSPKLRDAWLPSIRSLVLDGASARKPRLDPDGTLVIKEPHGSLGAPLLMEALPESRLIVMVRDPRDMVASALDAHRKGGYVSRNPVHRRRAEAGRSGEATRQLLLLRSGFEEQMRMAEEEPEEFARYRAELLTLNVQAALQAHDEHSGPKALVRYEDLRADPLTELARLLDSLEIAVEPGEVEAAVERERWENLPEEEKGAGQIRRKASPGGWRDDLTAEQAEIVSEIARPILDAFYAGD